MNITFFCRIAAVVGLSAFAAGCISDWEQTQRQNTIVAYQKFLLNHADSKYADAAKRQLDYLYWQNAVQDGSAAAYKNFICSYPQNLYVNEAKNRIAALSALKEGLSLQETEEITGLHLNPLASGGDFLDISVVALKESGVPVKKTLRCSADGYSFVFIDGKLAEWKMISPFAGDYRKTLLGKAVSPLEIARSASENGCRIAWTSKSPNGKVIVSVDGCPGREYDEIIKGSLKFSADGRHFAYAFRQGGKVCVVVDGCSGQAYDEIGGLALSFDGKHLAYGAKKGKKWAVLIDGQEINQGYDMVGRTLFSADGKHFAYTARQGGKWFAAVDGRHASPCEKIGSFALSVDGRRFAYAVGVGDKWRVVDNGSSGPEYDRIGVLTFSADGRRLAYAAMKDGEWTAVIDGRSDLSYSAIGANGIVFSSDGKHTAYAAEKYGQWLMVKDGQPGSVYDKTGIAAFSADGRRLAYAVRLGGRQSITVDGLPGQEYDAVACGPVFRSDGGMEFLIADKGLLCRVSEYREKSDGNMPAKNNHSDAAKTIKIDKQTQVATAGVAVNGSAQKAPPRRLSMPAMERKPNEMLVNEANIFGGIKALNPEDNLGAVLAVRSNRKMSEVETYTGELSLVGNNFSPAKTAVKPKKGMMIIIIVMDLHSAVDGNVLWLKKISLLDEDNNPFLPLELRRQVTDRVSVVGFNGLQLAKGINRIAAFFYTKDGNEKNFRLRINDRTYGTLRSLTPSEK